MISTGANLYHDLQYAPNFSLHRGPPFLDDVELYEQGIIRIYDVLFPATVLLKPKVHPRLSLLRRPPGPDVDVRVPLPARPGPAAKTPGCEGILGRGPPGRRRVPIYTSSPGDSSIGMNIADDELMNGSTFMIDPNKDVNEICAIILAGKQNGCVILGGGSPKNFYLQGQPTLWEVYGIPKGGNDYFIQITTDQVVWGGLSGATPAEAVSWGKVNPGVLPDTVVGTATRRLPSRCSANMRSGRRTGGVPGASCCTSGMSWWPTFSARQKPRGSQADRRRAARGRSPSLTRRCAVQRLMTWGWEGSWEHWRLS